jgi:hypothetical protein
VWFVARSASAWGGRGGALLAVALGAVLGVAVYAAVSRLLRAPELGLLVGALRRQDGSS